MMIAEVITKRGAASRVRYGRPDCLTVEPTSRSVFQPGGLFVIGLILRLCKRLF
jgi:hypothetical protein